VDNPIRILLVDDHSVVRAGFRWFLDNEPGIKIIAEAERGETACQLFAGLRPDIVVMDLTLPGMGGINTITRMVAREADARILVFSVHEEAIYVRHAISAGARGYISKRSAPEIMLEAIATVMEGELYVEAGLLDGLEDGLMPSDALSPREFEIFRLLALGQTSREIANELHLSGKTVANYVTKIKAKLNVRTAAELMRLAYRTGIVND